MIADAIEDVIVGRGWNAPLTEAEQLEVQQILFEAGVHPKHYAWMVASCPSVSLARRLYPPCAGGNGER